MINRPDYIAAIEPFIDKPLVKILAGYPSLRQVYDFLRC